MSCASPCGGRAGGNAGIRVSGSSAWRSPINVAELGTHQPGNRRCRVSCVAPGRAAKAASSEIAQLVPARKGFSVRVGALKDRAAKQSGHFGSSLSRQSGGASLRASSGQSQTAKSGRGDALPKLLAS